MSVPSLPRAHRAVEKPEWQGGATRGVGQRVHLQPLGLVHLCRLGGLLVFDGRFFVRLPPTRCSRPYSPHQPPPVPLPAEPAPLPAFCFFSAVPQWHPPPVRTRAGVLPAAFHPPRPPYWSSGPSRSGSGDDAGLEGRGASQTVRKAGWPPCAARWPMRRHTRTPRGGWVATLLIFAIALADKPVGVGDAAGGRAAAVAAARDRLVEHRGARPGKRTTAGRELGMEAAPAAPPIESFPPPRPPLRVTLAQPHRRIIESSPTGHLIDTSPPPPSQWYYSPLPYASHQPARRLTISPPQVGRPCPASRAPLPQPLPPQPP